MDKLYVIDIKVLHEFYMKYLLKNPDQIYWNKQISFYADQIANVYQKPVTAGAYIIDRNTANVEFIPLQYEDYLEDIEILDFCFENDILPACEDEKLCEKCQLKKLCKKEFNSVQDFVDATKEFIG